MAADALTQVNCASLADEAAVLERVFELGELPRLKDLLADTRGTLEARFEFAKLAAGRLGAAVTVFAVPCLVCQRCLQGFAFEATGGSEVEFATDDEARSAESEREFFRMQDGRVSLRELAEEELLLALPIAPACSTPATCGKAPGYASGETPDVAGEARRPFSALKDLLKKT